jgi:lipoate-protein ligase A
MAPTAPALVLGSTQRPLLGALGEPGPTSATPPLEVVVRRSGGGAVLVVPATTVWVDLVVGRDDPRWEDDLSASSTWLGEAWCRALGSLGIEARLVTGPYRPGRWDGLVCFAGAAAGEVTDPAGVKLVGISQRRTRHGARFQCLAHTRFDPEPLVRLLGPLVPPEDVTALAAAVAASTATVAAAPAALEAAVLDALGAPRA